MILIEIYFEFNRLAYLKKHSISHRQMYPLLPPNRPTIPINYPSPLMHRNFLHGRMSMLPLNTFRENYFPSIQESYQQFVYSKTAGYNPDIMKR